MKTIADVFRIAGAVWAEGLRMLVRAAQGKQP